MATPIGNMGDLSPRAAEVLGRVGLLCCEDTRRTGLLLQRAGIRAPRLAVCNEHTEVDRIADVVDVLAAGDDVALVSDAGTPGISDPGHRLVTAVLDHGHEVSALPGPAAFVAALTISGLPTDRFVFEGFLPRKGRARRQRLEAIAAEERTVVMYEAPHRLHRTLADLRDACGDDRQVVLARELTKLHEEVVRSTLGDVDPGEPRGEYVVVLDGRRAPAGEVSDDDVERALRAELAHGATTRDAATAVAAATGRRRREVYELAVSVRDGQGR